MPSEKSPKRAKAAKPTPEGEQPKKVATRAELAAMVQGNPFAYLTHTETRILFNFGEKSFRSLVNLGAPLVADKVLPEHLKTWLWENRERIGKLTAGEVD